jgi:hypothetical protein
MDDSTDGANPDPNDDHDPAEGDPTPFMFPVDATIGVAKDATWDDDADTATFTFNIEHFGNTTASNLSMTEGLDAIFGTGNYSITAPVLVSGPGTVTANSSFDGSTDREIIGAGSSLNPGETATIQLVATVNLIADEQMNGLGTFVNQVTIQAEDSDGGTYMDDSVDGTDPDPDGDGNPTDDDSPSNGTLTPDATVGGAKAAMVSADQSMVTFDFYIEHFGNTQATDISMLDNLDAALGSGMYTVLSITRISGPSTVVANGAFNGSTDQELIATGSSLLPNETAHIQVVADLTAVFGEFENFTTITTSDVRGGTYMDTSTDGTDPDPDGDGNPSEDDPTPFAIANGTIAGNVYVDSNDDGVFDSDETPIPGVTITLTGTDLFGNPVMLTTTTGPDGSYEFLGLFPGDYTITQEHPEDFLDGQDTPGNLGGTGGDDVIMVSLNAANGFMAESYNFGELGINPLAAGKDDFLASAGGGLVAPLSASESYVAPLSIVESDDSVEISSTTPDDVIEILSGLENHRVIINNVAYDYDAHEVRNIRVEAGAGSRVTVRGTTLADRADVLVNNTKLVSEAYSISVVNAEQVRVYGGGGRDQAFLVDSAGDDIFVGSASYASMRDLDSTYRHEAFGFVVLTGNAVMGGNDRAIVYDTASDDTLTSMPEFSRLQTGVIDIRANRFEQFEAKASYGGYDRAFLYDSDGDNKFVARPEASNMQGEGFHNVATGFERVEGISRSGGNDRAEFFDSEGDDRFVARHNSSFMIGTGFENRARGFSRVDALATAGGNDQAELFDTSGNDIFVGRHEYSIMQNDQMEHRAIGFDVVSGYAISGGTDAAFLSDGSGDDVFLASGNYAELRGNDFRNRTVGFDSVVADANSGGTDRAILQGTSAFDRLVNDVTRTTMSATGYRNTVDHFETIQAIGGAGNDLAEFKNVRSTEQVTGRGGMAQLSGLNRNTVVHGFARLTAQTDGNAMANADIQNIEYIFEQLGNWNNL